jgi:hypothetical protein
MNEIILIITVFLSGYYKRNYLNNIPHW